MGGRLPSAEPRAAPAPTAVRPLGSGLCSSLCARRPAAALRTGPSRPEGRATHRTAGRDSVCAPRGPGGALMVASRPRWPRGPRPSARPDSEPRRDRCRPQRNGARLGPGRCGRPPRPCEWGLGAGRALGPWQRCRAGWSNLPGPQNAAAGCWRRQVWVFIWGLRGGAAWPELRPDRPEISGPPTPARFQRPATLTALRGPCLDRPAAEAFVAAPCARAGSPGARPTRRFELAQSEAANGRSLCAEWRRGGAGPGVRVHQRVLAESG